MPYRETPPDPRLSTWVASLRFSRDDDDASARRTHRIVPDGAVDLLVSIPLRRGELQADVFGVRSTAHVVGGNGPRENVAVHFRPGAASRLLGIAAHELTDRRVDLEALWADRGASVAARVADAPDARRRGRVLECALLERVARMRARDAERARIVDAAIARIRGCGGRVPIRDLAAGLDVGERRLERVFRDEVGLAPKSFARVVRLNAALAALRAGRAQADVAADCGYSDQPHLQRDFRALAGLPPSALLAAD